MVNGNNSNVLVVDDSKDLVHWLCQDLVFYDFVTEGAYNGEDCLIKAAVNSFQFIILDIMMPGQTDLFQFCNSYPIYKESIIPDLVQYAYCKDNNEMQSLQNILKREQTYSNMLTDEINTPGKLFDALNASSFISRFGPVFVHFDGFTTCAFIKGNPRFRELPHVFLFTAGGGEREVRERRAVNVGASSYFLKSEYEPHLLNRLLEMRS